MERPVGENSVALLVERCGAPSVGLLLFLVNFAWFHLSIFDHADLGNRLLDRVIQASSVGVAFWGVAITLLIGMETKPVIVTLKKLGYFAYVVQYFSESLFACFSLLLVSVLLEPLSKQLSSLVCSSIWLGVGAWTLLATLRTYIVLAKILNRTAQE